MKVLIINASPKAKKSETLKIAQHFVKGMGVKAKEIDTINCKIKPCKGCYKCWEKKSRKCVTKDDMHSILAKIKKSDVVIWSTPLFCYSVPSTLKALLDRLTAYSAPNIVIDSDGTTSHPTIDALNAKHVLISASPLPDRENCFDAIKFQFTHMFGSDIEMILCAEKNLLQIKNTTPIATNYFNTIVQAGKDYVEYGHISKETNDVLSQPLIPTDMYIDSVNAVVSDNKN